jgi:hypothetical protein
MRHPSEADLALYAGGDLRWLERWKIGRHVAGCDRCRVELEAYDDLRSELPELNALPGLNWDRLEAEMRANIRLGLEAGRCVRLGSDHPRRRSGGRALVACATAAALLIAGVALQRPRPKLQITGVELGATANGIQLRDGDRALTLLHSGARDVTYSAGAQGAMRARYIDSETGQVTINNVYVQ